MTALNRVQRALIGGLNTFYAAPYRAASLEHRAWEWESQDASHAQLLDTLLGYYFSNALYQELGLTIAGAENTSSYQKIKSIRNPVKSFVDFYQFKLFPSPLVPMAIEKQTAAGVLPRIEEIWKRSAWERAQQRAAFQFPLFGELFIRAGQRESDKQPILQLIDPRHVTELDRDERGYIEWIRTEVPYSERDPQTGKVTEKLRIEVWQKNMSGARRRVWGLEKRVYVMANGTLPSTTPIIDDSTENGQLAIDFIPIAYAPFVSVDNGRGMSPVLSALEDIDEANRMATRLHAMLFRGGRTTWVASANAVVDGRPMPAPMLQDAMAATNNIELDDGDSILGLPGLATLTSLVPPLPYNDALAILQAHMDWITEYKLFELAYFKTDTGNEESGKARRYRLAPALNRAEQGRAMVLDALYRAHMMCFTAAQLSGVDGYSESEVGTFDNGKMEHTFQSQDMLIVSTEEKATTAAALIGAGAEEQAAYQVAGFSTAESEQLAMVGIPPTQ